MRTTSSLTIGLNNGWLKTICKYLFFCFPASRELFEYLRSCSLPAIIGIIVPCPTVCSSPEQSAFRWNSNQLSIAIQLDEPDRKRSTVSDSQKRVGHVLLVNRSLLNMGPSSTRKKTAGKGTIFRCS